MEREPSEAVERDGDIISRADEDSLEQTIDSTPPLYEPEGDYVFTAATRAAEELVGSDTEAPALTLEQQAVVRAYDAATEFVEKRSYQGIDQDRAWAEVDPWGKIKRDYEQFEMQQQDARNRAATAAIRQTTHDRSVAEIEKKYMYDPAKRDQAMHELLATERAQDERRGQRWYPSL